MSKKLISIILSAILVVSFVFPAFADTTYTIIDSVHISLSYNDFVAGTNSDENDVSIKIMDNTTKIEESARAMTVPSSGWKEGDVPNLRLTLKVVDDINTRFSFEAASQSGITVDNGDVHYGELLSSGRKVYYEIYLNEVQTNPDQGWGEKEGGAHTDGSDTGPGADGAKGAWLKDPNTNRWWYSIANGTRPMNSWLKISGSWYFFDVVGYLVTNQWIQTAGKWYYVGSDGKMLKNTKTPDGYKVGSDGAWDGKPKS